VALTRRFPVCCCACSKTFTLGGLAVGTYYFFDQAVSCINQMKITVTVVLPDEYVAPVPTPAPAVRPVQPVPATGLLVPWRFSPGAPYARLAIWQDDYLRFQWNDPLVAVNLRQVTRAAFDACDLASGVVASWAAGATTAGEVNVTGLEVGTAYFLSTGTEQCSTSGGNMRLAVDVAPGMARYFVSVWSAAGAGTAAAVTATFTGADALARVWVAPAVQINQMAVGLGAGGGGGVCGGR
jgi:hypothetical protein